MDIEEINAPDLEDTEIVNAEAELPDEQPEPQEGEGQAAEEDGPLVVSFGEDEPEAEPEGAAPEWVKELRKLTREQAKRIKELEQAQKANTAEPELGPEPTLEDYDYDPEAFKAAHRDWIKRSFEVEKEQESKRSEEQRQQEAFEQRVAEYNEAKAKLPVPDFDEAEAVLLEEFNPTQQGLLVKLAKQPALFAYALGKNPTKAKALAAVKDPVDFIAAAVRMEMEIKQVKRSAPAPEKRITGGNVGGATPVDNNLDRLRAEADRTGDYSKVARYKAELRKKGVAV